MNDDATVEAPIEFDPRGLISYAQIQNEVDQFAQVLIRIGIDIRHGSPLEEMCLTLLGLEERRLNPTLIDPAADIRVFLRPALGLHDIVRHVIRLQHKDGFSALVEHLRLLNSSTTAQNIAAPQDSVSAKIFELLIGLVCLDVGTNLSVDGPVRSYGDNPDILIDLDGKRWGFACKVLRGSSPKTLFDRLKEGVNQIETSPAEVGCTIINLKNQIPHDETWPIRNYERHANGTVTPTFGAWRSIEHPRDILREFALRRHEQLISIVDKPVIRKLFEGKKSIPGAMLFLQTATQLTSPIGPIASLIGIFNLMDLGGVALGDQRTLDRLNDGLHHCA